MYYNTNRWIDDLQQIVYSYNNAHHSSLGTSPLQVMYMDQSQLEDLWQRQYGKLSDKGAAHLERDLSRGYKVGDLVRVTHSKATFEKGFRPRWQRKVFKVVGSKYMKEKLVYKLEDLRGEEIKGWFYPEMLRPHIGAYNRAQVIQKVNKRTRQGINVKYLDWADKFNENLPLDQYNRIVERQHPLKVSGAYYPQQDGATRSLISTRTQRCHSLVFLKPSMLPAVSLFAVAGQHPIEPVYAHGDHICGMIEEQWGPLPHQKYVGWRCPIYYCEETHKVRCYMTGQTLRDPGEFQDPRVFVDKQEEYTKAQLSLSQDFSDHNLSLMMEEHDIEGLCSVTCSVTGEYLTEDEQVKFFTCLCALNDTYLHNHKKPTFNKITEYKILISIVASLSQGKYAYGNQYRLYTSLKTEVDLH